MGRRLVVSDIHGEGDRLVQALSKAGYASGKDRLFLLGDYIDRGTDPKRTVEIVQTLVRDGAVALKGNHDIMPRIVRSDLNYLAWWIRNGGYPTYESYGNQIPPDDVIDWLDSLPLYHAEPDCLMVHAGLLPERSVESQTEDELLWVREEFYNHYKGQRVYFGHTPTHYLHGKWEPWFGEYVTGVDTGAAYGGPLTVMDIDSNEMWTA